MDHISCKVREGLHAKHWYRNTLDLTNNCLETINLDVLLLHAKYLWDQFLFSDKVTSHQAVLVDAKPSYHQDKNAKPEFEIYSWLLLEMSHAKKKKTLTFHYTWLFKKDGILIYPKQPGIFFLPMNQTEADSWYSQRPRCGGLKTAWQRLRPKSMASDLFPRQALGNGNEDALACENVVGFWGLS